MEEKKTKKNKFNKNFWIYCGLAFLLLIVLITSIVINYQSKKLNDLEDANENIPKTEIIKIL